MKCDFSTPFLQDCFQVSWSCLPIEIQQGLKDFIRIVKEVEKLEGTLIYAKNQTTGLEEVLEELQKGGAVATYIDPENRCDIHLPSDYLTKLPKGHVIASILHELGHVYDLFLNSEIALQREHYEDETLAWDYALLWATTAILDEGVLQEVKRFAYYNKRCDSEEELARKRFN